MVDRVQVWVGMMCTRKGPMMITRKIKTRMITNLARLPLNDHPRGLRGQDKQQSISNQKETNERWPGWQQKEILGRTRTWKKVVGQPRKIQALGFVMTIRKRDDFQAAKKGIVEKRICVKYQKQSAQTNNALARHESAVDFDLQ